MHEGDPRVESGDFEAVDQVFKSAYAPKVLELRGLRQAIRDRGSYDGNFHNLSIVDYNAVVAEHDQQQLAEALESIGVIRREGETIRVDAAKPIEGSVSQAAVVELIRRLPMPQLTLRNLDPAAIQLLDKVVDLDWNLTTAARMAPEKRSQIAMLAERAGLLHRDEYGDFSYTAGADALSVRQKRMAMMRALIMHHSYSLDGLTDGWHNLLIDPTRFYSRVLGSSEVLIMSQHGTFSQEPWLRDGSMQIRDISQPSRWHKAIVFNFDSAHKKPLPETIHLKGERIHRERGNALLDGARAAFLEIGEVVDGLPDTVRLANHDGLKQVIAQHGMPTLHDIAQAGFVAPAYAVKENGNPRLDKYAFNGPEGYKRRAYFVTMQRDELTRWLASPEGQAWVNNDELGKRLRGKWHAELVKLSIAEADFVPPDLKPAYIVTLAALQQADAIVPLPYGNHVFPIEVPQRDGSAEEKGAQRWIYFPDEAKGKKYDERVQKKAKGAKNLIEVRHRLTIEFRLQQLTQLPVWQEWQPLPPEAGLPDNVRLVSMVDLRTAIEGLEPLNTMSLKRSGYIIDAQFTKTTIHKGLFIVCPKGELQVTRISNTDWFKKRTLKRGAKSTEE